MKDSPRLIQALIIIIGSLLFIPFLGHVNLFDWDEINFAEAAREMIVTKNYLTVQINYLPFWEKPPLFIWMQVLSMKVFGINEFAARLPNAICGVVTLVVLFRIGRLLRDNYFGILWVLVYACSILPFFYFKSGIIDPWFNLFIFLGVYCTFKYTLINKESWKRLFITLSGIFIGLGVLTKGPVALLIYALTFGVFFTVKMFKLKIRFKHILLFVLTTSLVGGLWFILQMASGNFGIIKDFMVYQVRLFSTKDAGHGGFFLYHFVILFFGVFPASLFAFLSFRREKKEDRENVHEFKNWMMTLFWTVLILFTIVKTKIVHYSSLCYFPLTFLGTYGIYKLHEQKQHMPRWLKILILTVSVFWGLVIIGLQVFVLNKERIIASGFIKDQFAIGNLQAEVVWTGYEFLIGLIFITAITLIYSTRRLKQEVQIICTLVLTLLFTYSTLLFVAPRIEGYSQHAAIEFYKAKQTEDCYITTLGFKSYAHLYYFNLKPFDHPEGRDEQWLLTGAIDKPAYFVMKNYDGKEYLTKYPELKVEYEENGFIFAKREAKP